MKITTKDLRLIRKLETQEFPEFIERNIYASPHTNYFYFAPSWHFESGLLTEEILEDIRMNGRQILSVGSGAAYLERFLSKKLGVKREQITLSDSSSNMPEGFEKFTFDMYGEWPNFRKNFDYMLFPESVLLNCRFDGLQPRQEGLYHLIKNSLARMKPVGQIRINGHSQCDDYPDAVEKWLKEEHTDSKLVYTPQLIVVERSKV